MWVAVFVHQLTLTSILNLLWWWSVLAVVVWFVVHGDIHSRTVTDSPFILFLASGLVVSLNKPCQPLLHFLSQYYCFVEFWDFLIHVYALVLLCFSGHPSCLKFSESQTKVVRSMDDWECYDCKKCAVCKVSKNNDNDMLICDRCDRSLHPRCCRPPVKKPPDGKLQHILHECW